MVWFGLVSRGSNRPLYTNTTSMGVIRDVAPMRPRPRLPERLTAAIDWTVYQADSAGGRCLLDFTTYDNFYGV